MLIENEEFERKMVSINQKLSQDGIEISARPLNASINLMTLLKTSAPLAGVSLEPANFPITAMNLSSHVNRWYENLYSEKLKVDLKKRGQYPFYLYSLVFCGEIEEFNGLRVPTPLF